MLKKGLIIFILFLLLIVAIRAELKTNSKNDYVNVIITPKSDANFVKIAKNLEKDELKQLKKYNNIDSYTGKIKKSTYEKIKGNEVQLSRTLNILLDQSAPLINADDVWNLTQNYQNIRGRGQTICIIDTGIKASHPAFKGRILAQHCFCGIDGGCCPNSLSEDSNASDDNGHGTHCAGIAAGNHSIYKGIAPEAGIVAVKVCNSAGSCDDSDVIAGVDWCLTNANAYNISVISMSLGDNSSNNDYCNSDPSAPIIDAAAAQNISVVIASGNDGYTNGISSPACIQNATPVGSTNDGYAASTVDAVSSFTSRGAILDIMAPGYAITAPYLTSDTATLAGTSMATPHVAGAIALIKQFLRLQNNTDISATDAEKLINQTGVIVDDFANSGKNYSRIDIQSAIRRIDNPPIIQFTNNSIANNTYSNTTALINITSNEILSKAWIEFNNTNTTMNASNTNFWIIISGNASYNYTVYSNDTDNKLGRSNTRIVHLANLPPTVENISISSTDNDNRTNGTISINFKVDDFVSNSLTNETRWYNNSIEIPSLKNQTQVNSSFTKKNQNWTASIRAYDGIDYSIWHNISITITNSIPTISPVENITVNESEQLIINITSADQDNEALTLIIDNNNFSLINQTFIWNTSINDSGDYIFNVTVNDSDSSSSIIIYATILDQIDTDNDGIPDFKDSDDDNDHMNDSVDFLLGKLSQINTTLNISLKINGSTNLSEIFNQTLVVNITENNLTLIEFNWTFNSTNILNLYNITITKQQSNHTSGEMIIKGINLVTQKKTILLDRIANISYVCIKDAEINNINEISSGCSGVSEFFIQCDGSSSNGYSCTATYNSTKYRITGLAHSGVKEQCKDADQDGYGIGCLLGADCNDADASKTTVCSTPSSSSGGGSGGGGGSTFKLVSDENTISSSFLNLLKGTEYVLKGKKEKLAVTKIKFYIKNFRLKGALTVNVSSPRALPPLKNVYQYFDVTPSLQLTKEDILNPVIEFRIKKSWLKKNDIEKIILYRYSGSWQQYNTNLLQDDINYSYYSASVEGFSTFAITGIANTPIITQSKANESNETNEIEEQFIEPPLTEEIVQVQKPSNKDFTIYWIISLIILIMAGILIAKKAKEEIMLNNIIKKHTKHRLRKKKAKKKSHHKKRHKRTKHHK